METAKLFINGRSQTVRVLVTNNSREFERVKALHLENWVE